MEAFTIALYFMHIRRTECSPSDNIWDIADRSFGSPGGYEARLKSSVASGMDTSRRREKSL